MILREEALNIIIKVIRNNLFSDKLLGQSIKKLREKWKTQISYTFL